MLWSEVIARSAGFLASKGVPDARTAAELLSARLLKVGRGFLAGALAREVPAPELEAMRRGMRRLVAGEPLQYVLGEWDFRSLTLKCDARALIPRPETEGLVSLVLKFLKSRPGPCLAVDVGTGTGAIALALASECPELMVVATDVSEPALKLAQENAAQLKLKERVRFLAMDGLDDFDEPEMFDVIVSNPPYVTTAEYLTLDPRVRDHEPRLALDGGEDGLRFYDRYLADALNLLKPGGGVFFEIGESQGPALRELLAGYGFGEIAIGQDLAGHDRYASAVLA